MTDTTATVGAVGIKIIPQVDTAGISQAARDYKARMSEALNSGASSATPMVNTSQMKEEGVKAGEEIKAGIGDAHIGQAVSQDVHDTTTSEGHATGMEFAKTLVEGMLAEKLGETVIDSIKEASNIQSNGLQIGAALGLSPEESEKYGKIAGNLFTSGYSDSLDTATQSVQALIQTFPDLKDASSSAITKMSQDASTFSKVFGMDVPTSLTTVKNMITQGLAPDVDSAYNDLYHLFQGLPPAMEGAVTASITKIGPYAKNIGLNSMQLFDIIKLGSAGGSRALMGISSDFKTLESGVTKGGKSTQTAFKELGLNFQQTQKQMAAGGTGAQKASSNIAESLLRIQDPAKRAQIATSLFGTGITTLGSKGLQQFLESMSNAKTTTDAAGTSLNKAGKEINNNFTNRWHQVTSSVEEAMGETLLPLLDKALPLLNNLSSFMKKNSDVMGPLLVIVLGLGAAFMGLSAVIKVMDVIGPIFTAEFWSFDAAAAAGDIALGPIILIILAIVGAVVLLMFVFGKLGITWKQVGQFLVDMAFVVVDGFIFAINLIIGAINMLLIALETPMASVNGLMQAMGGGGFSMTFATIPYIPYPSIPTLAEGGMVPAALGGTLAILGEAGQNEVVMNEGQYNAQQKSQTELNEKLIQNFDHRNNARGNTYINAANMNPYELERVLTARENLEMNV